MITPMSEQQRLSTAAKRSRKWDRIKYSWSDYYIPMLTRPVVLANALEQACVRNHIIGLLDERLLWTLLEVIAIVAGW
jgi:intracellular septation protein A